MGIVEIRADVQNGPQDTHMGLYILVSRAGIAGRQHKTVLDILCSQIIRVLSAYILNCVESRALWYSQEVGQACDELRHCYLSP